MTRHCNFRDVKTLLLVHAKKVFDGVPFRHRWALSMLLNRLEHSMQLNVIPKLGKWNGGTYELWVQPSPPLTVHDIAGAPDAQPAAAQPTLVAAPNESAAPPLVAAAAASAGVQAAPDVALPAAGMAASDAPSQLDDSPPLRAGQNAQDANPSAHITGQKRQRLSSNGTAVQAACDSTVADQPGQRAGKDGLSAPVQTHCFRGVAATKCGLSVACLSLPWLVED